MSSHRREADVAALTKRLMRHFDGRHHRFLVDYGWEDVARVTLRARGRAAQSVTFSPPAAIAAGELSNAVARFLRGELTLNELRRYMERYDAEIVAMATTTERKAAR